MHYTPGSSNIAVAVFLGGPGLKMENVLLKMVIFQPAM